MLASILLFAAFLAGTGLTYFARLNARSGFGSLRVRSCVTAAAEVLDEHRLVLALSLAYIGLGGAVLTFTERQWPIALVGWPTVCWLACSTIWLAARASRSRLMRESLAPRPMLGAFLVMLLVVPLHITFQSLKQAIGSGIGFHADLMLHRADLWLHGGPAWQWFAVIFEYPTAVRVLDSLYMTWLVVLAAFLVWASWSSDRAYRQRTLLAFLLMWIVTGTALAALGASAGPCYYGDLVAGLNPYADLLAALDATPGQVLWARANQYNIWNAYQTGIWYPVAGISAMPSMHVGMAVLWALVAWGRSRWLGLVLTCYALAIQIGSVLLGWHYAVDGYVAALVAAALWRAAGAATRNSISISSVSRARV